MSVNTGYNQYLRKYRLFVISRQKKTITKVITKTIVTTPAVPATPSVTTWTGKITGGRVNFRAGPSTKYRSYGILEKGTALTVVNKSGTWYKIEHPKGENGIAYVHSKYIKITGTKAVAGTAAQAAVTKEVQEAVTETVDADIDALDLSELRCVFYCEKSMSDTPNYSQISVYNMSQDTISGIKAGDKVILEAGYEKGNYGMVFTGQIIQPLVHRESSTEIVLTLIVQDGDEYLTSAFTAQTLSKASTQADIVRACVNGRNDVSSGLITSQLSKSKLARGKVLFGKSASYLKNVASGSQSQLYIEDGKVNIVAAKDYASNQAVELNPMTGLIGMPEQTDDGVKGQCLINPSIKLNTLIYINSKLVTQKQVDEGETTYSAVNTDGVYRIIKLTMEGDTHGDQWYQTFEAITQSGTKPTGMSSSESNPWR